MISKGVNNKQQNQVANPCDAGSVVMGRDGDNGSYKILKLNSNGEIVPPASFLFGINYSANNNGVPANVPPLSSAVVDTYIANVPISFIGINEGIYNIFPFVTFQTTTNAVNSINIFLVKENSNLDFYFQTLNPISDNFAPPSISDTFGLVEFWHNVNMSTISNITRYKQTNQANLQRSVYLNGGNYKIYITANNPFIFDDGAIVIALSNFEKIG
jgi:hypothetical protein